MTVKLIAIIPLEGRRKFSKKNSRVFIQPITNLITNSAEAFSLKTSEN